MSLGSHNIKTWLIYSSLGDYLSGILGTFREASEWYLNPLEEIRKGGKTTVNRAEGNCVSAEFNLLYRVRAILLLLSPLF